MKHVPGNSEFSDLSFLQVVKLNIKRIVRKGTVTIFFRDIFMVFCFRQAVSMPKPDFILQFGDPRVILL